MKRSAVVAGLLLAMVLFGFGVYHAAALLKADRPMVHRPTEISAPAVPGTLYLVQAGAIYRFEHGQFAQITPESGWTQPSLSPDGHQMVAVQRHTNYSDLYLLTPSGKTIQQLTSNSGERPENNHWVFYPRFSPDGSSLFYDFDPKDPYNNFHVDLAIFASSAGSSWHSSKQWTNPNDYSGGDVTPVPLRGGGLIYTKFVIDDQYKLHSQIWMQSRAGSPGVALTPPELDCVQPALSPDLKEIAMVCTRGQAQAAELDVAGFDAATSTAGPPTAAVQGELVASPAFSPDGKSIAYLGPARPGGEYQLWTVTTSTDHQVRDITTDLGLDSASAPIWVSG
jgi:Tol biopolymer transport system component